MSTARPHRASTARTKSSGSLILGTGLAFASLILVPALATSIGLGPSMTGALRMALMKASNRAVNGSGVSASKPANAYSTR